MRAEIKQFSQGLDFQKMFEYLGISEKTNIGKARKILKRKSWIHYICKRQIQKIKTNGNVLTVADYIKENPNRCRTVVEYIQDDKTYYSVGMNKKVWDKWFE